MRSLAVRITNPLGLHARAAARFVHAASAFSCQVRVACGSRVMDGKSIMGLLLLAAAHGTEIVIATDGPDEAAAIETLAQLVAGGFEP